MIDPPLTDLGMADTEYAQMVAHSCDSVLERRLIELGCNPGEARKTSQFVSLLQRTPQTSEEWEELMSAWEDACGYKPNFD